MELLLVLTGICCFSSVVSVPILSESPSNKLEDLDDMEVIDDDFTTRGMERLSSAATCLVAGIEYTHGQQINRIDPCEFCLCLDGEMFCWWQDCPPATDGPCKDQGPFSQCDNIIATKAPPALSKKDFPKNITSKNGTSKAFTDKEVGTKLHSNKKVGESTKTSSSSKSQTTTEHNEMSSISSEIGRVVVTTAPSFCIVMGIEYRIGDKLPHDTGNCIECVCGQGAKITCSPHQCAPLGEEINDYRPPEPRLTNSDSF